MTTTATAREKAELRAQLRVLGLPTSPPTPESMTLRELEAWRHNAAGKATATIRRELFTPTGHFPKKTQAVVDKVVAATVARAPGVAACLGIERLSRPVSAQATRAQDVLLAAASGVLGAGVLAALATLSPGIGCLAMVGAGLLAADGTAWLFHRQSDEVYAEKHAAGTPPSLGKDFWLHHLLPGNLSASTALRAAATALPVTAACYIGAAAAMLIGSSAMLGTFLVSLGTGFTLAQLLHRAAHKKNPSRFERALQKIGFASSPEYHGLHHRGDRRGALPGEQPVRHVQHFHVGLGYLSPIRLLDVLGLETVLNRIQYRFSGRPPMSYRENPNWKGVWEAPHALRRELSIAARAADYREMIQWFEETRNAAANTLASTGTGEERDEAATAIRELDELLGRMRSALAGLENDRLEAVAERQARAS